MKFNIQEKPLLEIVIWKICAMVICPDFDFKFLIGLSSASFQEIFLINSYSEIFEESKTAGPFIERQILCGPEAELNENLGL